jgi:hypothetical protein
MDWALQSHDLHAVNHFGVGNPVLYMMMSIIILPTVFSWFYGKTQIEKDED